MKRSLLLDVDPGIDDALAILYALKHPGIDLLGITCVAGNVPVSIGVANARKILHLFDRDDVPVRAGAEGPLEIDLVTAQDTHGENGLGEVELPPAPGEPSAEDAIGFLRGHLEAAEGKVLLLALGPLTNIARLIETDEALVREKAEIVIMGGAAKSHGNCSPVAEFNFWVDPHAAARVFARLDNLTLVPLDVTRDIILTPDYRELALRLGGKEGRFIHDITRFYVDFHWEQERTLGCVINDPLAVAIALDPSLGEAESYYVEIIEDGPSRGQSIVDFAAFHRKAANASIYLRTDSRKFFRQFFGTIFPDKEDDLSRVLSPREPFQVRRP